MTRLIWVLGVCVAVGGVVHLLRGTANDGPHPSLERQLLDAARSKPEDPVLGALFDELNTRHFAGTLPNVDVMWESGLDRLDAGDYRLNGMTDGKIILLKPAAMEDDESLRRTLCHEMVHVKFIAAGNTVTTHDSVFQAELRRIFEDGCFEAILASPEEKESLRTWIDAERTRLDAARMQAGTQAAAVKAEADAVERMFADLNERIRVANSAGSGWPSREEVESAERRQTDSNTNIVAHNATLADIERDQAQFNDVVRRYNLMIAYPDGLAEDRAKGLIR